MAKPYLTELQSDNLASVRHHWLNGQHTGTRDAQNDNHRKLYEDVDLDVRAKLWADVDSRLATSVLAGALADALAAADPRALRVLIVGAGTGRLVEYYLATSRAAGVAAIVFNDLYDFHIAAVRAKIEGLDPSLRLGISITYAVGDFAEAALGTFDVIIAAFFVTAEIADCRGGEETRVRRQRFFAAVRGHLKPNGLFLEDTPDADTPGFYQALRRASSDMTADLPCLGTSCDRANFVLSHVDTEAGTRSLVRYIPDRAGHIDEMWRAGLELSASLGLWADPEFDDAQFPHRKWADLWKPARPMTAMS